MSSDTSGKAIAKLYQAHTPTPDEEKTVAALWIFITVGAHRGTLSDVFVASDLPQRVAQMASNYPGLLKTCSSSAVASTSAALSCDTFACNASCYPNSRFLSDLKDEAIKTIGEELSKYVLGKFPVDKWYGIEAAMRQQAADMTVDFTLAGKDVTDAILTGIDFGDARQVNELVGNAFTAAETVGNAVVLVGGGVTAVELTELAGVAGTLWTVQGLASELVEDANLVRACWAFKDDACGPNAPHLGTGQCASNAANLITRARVPNALVDQPCLFPCRGAGLDAGPGGSGSGGATGAGGSTGSSGAAGTSGGGSGAAGGTTGIGGSSGTAGIPGAGGSLDAGATDAGNNACCACDFDVYCTVYGQGGCWYCTNSTYLSGNGPCQATGLASPGKCTCDPTLYQVCR